MLESDMTGETYTCKKRALVHLVVYEHGDVVSLGTGVACSESGCILTAAHVVPPTQNGEQSGCPDRLIVGFRTDSSARTYSVKQRFSLRSDGFKKDIPLDLAFLVPLGAEPVDSHHLRLCADPPTLGDEVVFGGFSTEVEFPFQVDRMLAANVEGFDVLKGALRSGIKERLAGPMLKRGTVGNVVRAEAVSSEGPGVRQTVFYIDNAIHDGASGGPIVTEDGQVRGIISKCAVVRAGDVQTGTIKVPSGSTLGVGLDPLLGTIEPIDIADGPKFDPTAV